MTLSPGQKKLLTYGLPVVVALGLFAWYRSRNSTPAAATSATTSGDTAIGIDQLAAFESAIQSEIAGLSGVTAAPAPSTPKVTTPAGPQTPANPFQVGTVVTPSTSKWGEQFVVESVYDPAVHSWLDLLNSGGVYTSGNLPLTGSAFGKGQTFGPGGLTIGANGAFIEKSSAGKVYRYAVKK